MFPVLNYGGLHRGHRGKMQELDVRSRITGLFFRQKFGAFRQFCLINSANALNTFPSASETRQ